MRCLAAKHAELKEGAMREDAALAASKRRMCMHTAFGAGALLGMIGGKRRGERHTPSAQFLRMKWDFNQLVKNGFFLH